MHQGAEKFSQIAEVLEIHGIEYAEAEVSALFEAIAAKEKNHHTRSVAQIDNLLPLFSVARAGLPPVQPRPPVACQLHSCVCGDSVGDLLKRAQSSPNTSAT